MKIPFWSEHREIMPDPRRLQIKTALFRPAALGWSKLFRTGDSAEQRRFLDRLVVADFNPDIDGRCLHRDDDLAAQSVRFKDQAGRASEFGSDTAFNQL